MTFFQTDFISKLKKRNKIFLEVINSKEMQRLKKISFLGLLHKIFNMKEIHSRYDHSLGVAYLGLKFCEFNNIKKEDEIYLILACLLHDIGHFALSHLTEKVFNTDHKEHTLNLIRKENDNLDNLDCILKKYSIDKDRIIEILRGDNKKGYYSQLILGKINLDTIDAISRCAYVFDENYTNPIKLVSYLDIQDSELVLNKKKYKFFDKFWLLKNKIYQKYIYNEKNLKLEATFNYIIDYLSSVNKGFRFGVNYKEMDDKGLISNILRNFNGERGKLLNNILEGKVLNELNVIKVNERTYHYKILSYIEDELKKRTGVKIYEKRKLRKFYIHNTIDFYGKNKNNSKWDKNRYKIKEYYILICAFKELDSERISFSDKISFEIPKVTISKELEREIKNSKESHKPIDILVVDEDQLDYSTQKAYKLAEWMKNTSRFNPIIESDFFDRNKKYSSREINEIERKMLKNAEAGIRIFLPINNDKEVRDTGIFRELKLLMKAHKPIIEIHYPESRRGDNRFQKNKLEYRFWISIQLKRGESIQKGIKRGWNEYQRRKFEEVQNSQMI